MKLLLFSVGMQLTLLGRAFSQNEGLRPSDPPVLRCPVGHLKALVFSPDGKWIAAAYCDFHAGIRLVGVWDTRSLRPIFVDREKAGCKGIEALAFSPDNKQLLAVGDSQDRNELLVWDTASGKRIKQQVWPRERHDPHRLWCGQIRELLRGADGRWLLHDTAAGLVTDVATRKVVHDYDKKHPDREPGVFGQGGIIVSGDEDDGPRLVYDAATGKLLNEHPRIKGGLWGSFDFSARGAARSIFCSRGRCIVTKTHPPTRRVIDFDTRSKNPEGTQLSPDGRWLAISYQYRQEGKGPVPALFPGEYEYQQVFDTTTGRPVGAPIGGMGLYFSPQGARMAVVSRDDHICIIDVPGSAP